MTAKEYLTQYRQIEKEIGGLLEERTRWVALAEKMTPSLSGMPGGAVGGDRLGETVAKIVDLEREIDAKVDELMGHYRKIREAVSQIPDAKEREVLMRRYMQGQSWEEIAERMGVTERWVYQVHKRAIFSLHFSKLH